MKKVALVQLKSEFFSAAAVVESVVQINTRDMEHSCKELGAIISDLEALKEALFFKAEKLKRKLGAYDQTKYAAIATSIESMVSAMQIPELGASEYILEKNREISELKDVQKYLRYTIEINNNSRPVLDALLSSEIKDNWVFLSKLVSYSLLYNKNEIFLEYSKRIEEKMVRQFKKAIEDGEEQNAKTALTCLKQLDKEMILLDEYMLTTNMFKTEIEIAPPAVDIIDLDKPAACDDAFSLFIEKLSETLESNLLKFSSIFGYSEKYCDYIFGKMYRMVVFRNLEGFLSISSPVPFLQCLSSAYKTMVRFSKLIKERYPQFEPDFYMHEGFSPYITKAVQKEKQGFDDVFSILMQDAKCINKYVLMGERVAHSDDALRVYEKMLCVVNLMKMRSSLLYEEKDENELLRYFYRKMLVLLDVLMAKTADGMELIRKVSYIYLLTRKYWGGECSVIKPFISRIETILQDAFREKLQSSGALIKRKVDNLNFSKEDGHRGCLGCVKSCIQEAEVMKGRNYEAYADGIFNKAYTRLHKHVFTMVYTETQSRNMLRCIEEFIGYASLLNQMDAVKNFSHLREIGRLVSVDAKLFRSMYEEFKGSISDKELKDLIKCRRDKEAIKALMELA